MDPFRNPSRADPWFERDFPRIEVDVLLITHPHFDHDGLDRVAFKTVLRAPGEFKQGDIVIRGVLDRHAGPYGQEFGQRNVIFLVETAGTQFCHVGDNRADLPDDVRREIGCVDFLMLPVDASNHLLTYAEVKAMIGAVRPKVVVPTHYFMPGLTNVRSTLGGVEDWLATRQLVRRIYANQIQVRPGGLPASRDAPETWVFEQFATK
ncbi:MAG TPA: hypothetical protein EYH31_00240 [Anaerolineae bacterium]|nr:hypothetical protein [Anaerolineae bacterium]